ncbi:hypothetical protein B0J12DRAFT_382576 [Macrophomina phaseolina]|uniref:Secreted peptide n=1 Tax=Macrophomina phaseolina TaxID=35725 RepID=A0ABQ8GKX9_9PEZI|nr:hypothetical protein B0J12DRAFT_382576 [Macrophomina phaseolina]
MSKSCGCVLSAILIFRCLCFCFVCFNHFPFSLNAWFFLGVLSFLHLPLTFELSLSVSVSVCLGFDSRCGW